jgi:tetratricopeptide (TPR) repeat protein
MKYLNPLQWMRWFGQFIASWGLSLPWLNTFMALPAVILLMALLATFIISTNTKSEWRNNLLNKQLMVALEAEDSKTAELVISRQLLTRPDDADLLFRLGLAKQENGDKETAMKIMESLAAVKNYEDAARFVIREKFINKEWAKVSGPDRQQFGSLLELVVKGSPSDTQMRQLYAEYLMAVENFPAAIEQLESISRQLPMRGLQAAALARRIGNAPQAERLARAALVSVDELFKRDPTNPILALAVAQNQIFLSRHEEAVETLENALMRVYQQASVGTLQDPDPVAVESRKQAEAQLAQALGDTLVTWVAYIREQGDPSNTEKLRVMNLLQKALQVAPNNPRVLQEVADVVLRTTNNENEEIQQVRTALVKGTNSGFAHFVLGTAALMNEDSEVATRELGLAATEMPNSGAVLNNLAVSMAARDSKLLPKALVIVNKAIDVTPGPSAHFHETRGQILLRLGKYLEAIPDLEMALKVEELVAQAHGSLADCYSKIGDADMAKLHREAQAKAQEKKKPSVLKSEANKVNYTVPKAKSADEGAGVGDLETQKTDATEPVGAPEGKAAETQAANPSSS